jgi:hypothetical protein
MENIYLYMIIALAFLAIADLVVGISNDAVNFQTQQSVPKRFRSERL